MTKRPDLIDRRALAMHRARAARDGLFLQESAADEIKDRINSVNRAFTAPAVVTPFPALWTDWWDGAKVVMDSEVLALEVGAHDLVVHSLSLHWANDPVGQLIQCHRALKPDGLFIAATLGGQTLEELRRVLGQAEVSLTGGLSPRILPMGEIRDLGALLQRAGFALPVADSLRLDVNYKNARHLMHDLRHMGETNALTARQRSVPQRALFENADKLYQEHFGTEDDRIRATFELVFLTGWAPDPSQQKPLRPGSAKQRLADALKVPETPLRD